MRPIGAPPQDRTTRVPGMSTSATHAAPRRRAGAFAPAGTLPGRIERTSSRQLMPARSCSCAPACAGCRSGVRAWACVLMRPDVASGAPPGVVPSIEAYARALARVRARAYI